MGPGRVWVWVGTGRLRSRSRSRSLSRPRPRPRPQPRSGERPTRSGQLKPPAESCAGLEQPGRGARARGFAVRVRQHQQGENCRRAGRLRRRRPRARSATRGAAQAEPASCDEVFGGGWRVECGHRAKLCASGASSRRKLKDQGQGRRGRDGRVKGCEETPNLSRSCSDRLQERERGARSQKQARRCRIMRRRG